MSVQAALPWQRREPPARDATARPIITERRQLPEPAFDADCGDAIGEENK
jgi:hypothetical protein